VSRIDLEGSCKRKEMRIDFAEIRWDSWIIAPTGFDAYYCAGHCEYPLTEVPYSLTVTVSIIIIKLTRKSNHAVLQSFMNIHFPSIPEPCCVPDKMSSITIIYRDELTNTMVLKVYPDMAVDSCACR